MPEMSDLCCLGKTRVDNLLNLKFINILMNLIAEDFLFEFFLNNTNLTFLAFLYKLTSRGFKISKKKKKKKPPLGTELTTPTPLLESQLPYPLSQSASPWQSQTFRPL